MSTLHQANLFDEPMAEVPATVGIATVKAVETTHLLTPGKGRTEGFDYTLNPYRGCSFGCSYCFAAFFVADEEQKANWGKWVEAKVQAADSLRRKDIRGKKIFMSSATDPYQPLEKKLRLTRQIVEILAAQQVRLVVQTRSPLAARDADLFQRFDHVRVNMSITTDDDRIRKRFEPGCASIARRLEALEKLIAAKVPVAACVCPMLPMADPFAFGRRLAAMGVGTVVACWFHMSDKPFAAGTRDPARALMEEFRWDRPAFERCRSELMAGFGGPDRGYDPI